MDSVDSWKHAALSRALQRSENADPASQQLLQLQLTSGFACLVLFAWLVPLTVLHWPDPAAAGRRLLTPLEMFALACMLPTALIAHELPRVLLARARGQAPRLILSGAGSDAEIVGGRGCAALPVWMAFAGSGGNFLAGALATALARNSSAREVPIVESFTQCQLAWGLAQALPLAFLPVGAALARRLQPGSRLLYAALSVVGWCSVAALLGRWATNLLPILMLSGSRALGSFVAAFRAWCDVRTGAHAQALQAAKALLAGDCRLAASLARGALALARTPALRGELNRTLAWAALGCEDPILARLALERLAVRDLDLQLVAAYLSCCNRLEEAAQLLKQARARGHRARETSKLLIDALYRSGKPGEALLVARADRDLLSDEEREAVEASIPSGIS